MDLASLLNQNSYTKGTSKMEKEAVEESSKRQMVKSMKAITSKICAKDKEDACILTSQYMKVSGVKDWDMGMEDLFSLGLTLNTEESSKTIAGLIKTVGFHLEPKRNSDQYLLVKRL